MWVYDNDTVSDTFIVDLTKDRDVQDNLPCNFLSVRNDSSLVAFVYLDNRRVGAVQAYSSDPFIGKDFEIIRIVQPDGDNFAIGDLFLQVGKNEQLSSTPYNPSWDLMEENIDVYASGCNSRLSFSASMPLDTILYRINAENSKICQRRLSVQGSASLGSYEIIFDSETIISGGVPINGEVLDTKQYKKIIQNCEFDYSVTNASIKGWLIDYKILDDACDIGTKTIGLMGNSHLAYDNDFTINTDDYVNNNTAWLSILEFELPTPKTIKTVSIRLDLAKGGANVEVKTQGYTSSWIDLTPAIVQSASAVFVEHIQQTPNINLDNVTKVRVVIRSLDTNNYNSRYADFTFACE